MKLTAVLALVSSLALPTFATSVTYDQTYDNANGSMNTVACSNGPHGLVSRYPTFGKLPKFPYIGGAEAVTGWNSPNCGTCWELTFTDGQGKQKSINVLAIDYCAHGFNIALTAMNDLTSGHGVEYGVVDVTSKQVPATVCGMPA